MTEIILKILDEFWLAVGTGVLIYGVVAVIVTNVRRGFVSRAREASRREIAAYVAAGTMTTEQAVRLLEGTHPEEDQDLSIKLAEAVSEGTIEEADAERLGELRGEMNERAWRETVQMVVAGMPVNAAARVAKGGTKPSA